MNSVETAKDEAIESMINLQNADNLASTLTYKSRMKIALENG